MRWLEGAVRVLERPLLDADPDGASAHAIVVLGAPLREDGVLSAVLAERVAAGVELWRRGLAPVICVTGGPTRPGLGAEADAMADEARRLGVPESALVVERESRSTYDNARCVARLLLPDRPRVWLVTTPFHTRRAKRWFRAAGFRHVRAWHVADSVQYAMPRKGLEWVAREYVAWTVSGLLTLRDAVRRGAGGDR